MSTIVDLIQLITAQAAEIQRLSQIVVQLQEELAKARAPKG